MATSAASGGHGELGEPEQADAGDLAGQQVAGGHAGQQHLDDPAGLLLHDAGQHEVPVDEDGHEQQDGHHEGGRLVVGAAPGDQPSSTFSTGTGATKARRSSGSIPAAAARS